MNSERHDKFDFIPIVPERMVLASMSDPSTYLGGDTGLLMRPFRKETWLAILLMIILLMTTTKLFTFELKITKKSFDFSGKIRNIAYISVSFFFLLILAYYEGALIMFFSYFLFFSPMAQCKTALKKKSPNTTKDNLVLVCQELLKRK